MRGKGEGGIYRRSSDNLWCASVELPARDGKRRRKVITSKNKNVVIRKLLQLKQHLEIQNDVDTKNQTLGTWIDTWFETVALMRIRPKTAATYRTLLKNHIAVSW